MSYIIYASSGTVLTTIPTGKTNTATTSLTLIGRDVPNYGRYINQNLVYMLSNFANSTVKPPANPLTGQLWFDTTYNKLKVNGNSGFQVVGSAVVNDLQPVGQEPGEFWYDSTQSVLKFLDNNGLYNTLITEDNFDSKLNLVFANGITVSEVAADIARAKYGLATNNIGFFNVNESAFDVGGDFPFASMNTIAPIISYVDLNDTVGYVDGMTFSTTFLEDHIGPIFQFGDGIYPADWFNIFADSVDIGAGTGQISISGTTVLVDSTLTQVTGDLYVLGGIATNSMYVPGEALIGQPVIANTPPAHNTSTGIVGEIAVDSQFIYVCTATNSWARVALSYDTW